MPLPWNFRHRSGDPYLTAEQCAKLYTDAMEPYQGDPFMVDHSDGPTGIYSDSKVKQVAWIKHYEKFWGGAGETPAPERPGYGTALANAGPRFTKASEC
jgi:hypothetical protein